MNDAKQAINRRNFFGLLGTGVSYGSLLAAAPAMASEELGWSRRDRPSAAVGVIVPRSHLYSGMGASFQAGLEMALGAFSLQGREIAAEVAMIDVGGAGLQRVLTQMLSTHRPSIILGMLDARLAEQAASICASDALFIDCSAGAIVALASRAQTRHLRCTLGQWQSAFALGRWAAGQGKRAAILSTFYDAGYDGLYAFRLGFEEGGGEVPQAVIIDAPHKPLGIAAALTAVARQAPDVVYAAIHDHQAGPFMAAWSASPSAADVLLVANPFMVEHACQHAQLTPAEGVLVCSSYDPALAVPENQDFRRRFQERHQRMPDAYAVLGHDAGTLVATALGRAPAGASVQELMAACTPFAIDSPRGRIAMDAEVGSLRMPHYLSLCSWSHAGLERRIIDRVESIDETDPRMIALRDGLRSGWVNPYMSV
jgi:branched-chain amino acid transport system substrate-binding protein